MSGQIVTFYSYKGGVGRSFALVNIAAVMAEWGYKVLCIDFDIEAPGLTHYFSPWTENKSKPGLVELIEYSTSGARPNWRNYCQTVDLQLGPGSEQIEFISAGEDDTGFAKKVQRLNWDELYEDHNIGAIFESFSEEWKQEFDFILIDGRTGITAFSGVFTAQLPDILVFMFTANHQSLDGCIDVVNRATAARNELVNARGSFLTLPIPSRFEASEEYDLKEQWKEIFADKLKPYTEAWAHKGIDLPRLIDLATIPYFSYWSFGEEIATLKEKAGSSGVRNTGLVSYSMETLAALLAHHLGRTEILEDSRDSYVHAARRVVQRRGERYDVFLSYGRENREQANEIAKRLMEKGLSVWFDRKISAGDDWQKQIEIALNKSDNLIALFGNDYGTYQEIEVRTFLSESITDNRIRRIIPVITDENAIRFLRDSQMMNFQRVDFFSETKNENLEKMIYDLSVNR